MQKVNSFILSDNIISEMKNKIKETKKLKIETGFALCEVKTSKDEKTYKDADNSKIIIKGTDCIGTKCSIKTGRCLNINHRYIGNFHTHPISHPTMSIVDMVTGCSEEIECIGSAPYNTIRCFTRKTFKSDCLNEVASFEEDERNILEKGEEIRKLLKNPKLIIKTGIPKLIMEIYQHDKKIASYHTERLRLLKNNFNRIDIIQ